MNFLGVDFFGFILFKFHLASWICRLMEDFANLGLFQPLFPQMSFQFHSLAPLLGFQLHGCWVFCYCPTGQDIMRTVLLLLIKFKRSKWKKKKFCSFFLFISLFSHLFRLGIVHWSVIRFTNSILCHFHLIIKTIQQGTSPVAQWLRIHLPMQGTWVQSLVWEDPTWHGATKPMCHNYWVCALEPVSHSYWAHVPQLLKPVCLGLCSTTREATAMRSLCTTTKSSPCSPQLEKACVQQWRPNTTKNLMN